MNTNPRNAQEALQQAKRYERAKNLLQEGYTFTDMEKDGSSIAVCKPGRLAASYWIVDGECSCPDSMKTQQPCKHMLTWDILQAEEADDAANMAAQCALWEDQNLPLLPELPKLAKDVVRAMEQDLQKVNADIDAQGERRTGYIHCQHQRDRAGRLENAITVVNSYARPDDVPEAQFCTVCGIANLHGPRCNGDDCPRRITA